MFPAKVVCIAMMLALAFLHQSESVPILAKVKAIKGPLVAAKVGVVTDVATKIGAAASKQWVASKAKGAAVVSIAVAPLQLAKTAMATKIGTIKSVKATLANKINAIPQTGNQAPTIPAPVVQPSTNPSLYY